MEGSSPQADTPPPTPLERARHISSALGKSAVVMTLLTITMTVLARAFGYHCAECDAPKLGRWYNAASLYFQVRGGLNLLAILAALGAVPFSARRRWPVLALVLGIACILERPG